MSNTPSIALKRIQQAAKNKSSSLDLSSLELKEIPQELALLKDHLKILDLSNNKIDKIQNLENLNKLSRIYLSNNQIKDIKSLFSLLEKNWKINLTDYWSDSDSKEIGLINNPLNNELVTAIHLGNGAIFRYYEQLELGTDYIREVKVVLVGDAELGKTSLLRKLEDINQKLPEAEDRTLGIEISQLPLWKD